MTDLLLLRLARGEDLVEAIETACRDHAITDAIVHAGPGSLDHACLEADGQTLEIPGPGVEILTLQGEIRSGRATLDGTVGDPEGRVYAGLFRRSRNPICITAEVALEAVAPA